MTHWGKFRLKVIFIIMKYRRGSRTAATSKVELFVIIVNGFEPLTIITKSSTLDVATVLDPPLTYSDVFWWPTGVNKISLAEKLISRFYLDKHTAMSMKVARDWFYHIKESNTIISQADNQIQLYTSQLMY